MHLKIFHAPVKEIDAKYQSWVKNHDRDIEVISFVSQTAYQETTLTVQYVTVKKGGKSHD